MTQELIIRERIMRAAKKLSDTSFFEEIYNLATQRKIIKPILDKYIKNELINKLNDYKVNISDEDFNIIDSIWLPGLEIKSPFHAYYNLKYHQLSTLIEFRLKEEIFDLSFLDELQNNPKKRRDFIKKMIEEYTKEVAKTDLIILDLIQGNVEALQNHIKVIEGKVNELENEGRTFTIQLLKKMKRIEMNTSPKPKHIQCALLACEEIKNENPNSTLEELRKIGYWEPDELFDKNTKETTHTGNSLVNSYKTQKNKGKI